MFLLVLGGSLVLGAGLLAAASLGTLVTISTAAQCIGWLFILATAVGVISLRHANFGQLGAATVTFLSGLAVLYFSYFQRDEIRGRVRDAPIRHAAAETRPALPVAYRIVDRETVATVLPPATKQIPLVAAVAAPKAARDLCESYSGFAWILCREKARLEYCEGREDDEATCPSALPFSPPG